MSDTVTQAADLLLAARRGAAHRLADLPAPLVPRDKAAAYAIQHKIAASFEAIGGWKVGAPGPDGPPTCGALPASGVSPSPATRQSSVHVLRGIEAEVCFRMARDLPPRPSPYSRQEVIDAIAAAHPAIELLESRFVDPDAVDPLSNLADTLAHGGFVHGPGTARWRSIDFANEKVELHVDGALVKESVGNPAGDMIRLVVWMANEGSHWAGGLKQGQFVTCGSWTGKDFVGPTSHVRVHYPSLGDVVVTYTE